MSYNINKPNLMIFKYYSKNQSKDLNKCLFDYYQNYLNNVKSSNSEQKNEKNQNKYTFNNLNNINKIEYPIVMFLECLLCCNSIEKYDMDFFGNNIEVELFDNMKWDIKQNEDYNNNNYLKLKFHKEDNFSKENKNKNNSKFNYQYYYITRKITDIFPKNYYKLAESSNQDYIKNSNINKETKNERQNYSRLSTIRTISSNSSFYANQIQLDIANSNINSFRLRIYKKFINNGSLSSASIVYNFLTNELRFMIKGNPDEIINMYEPKLKEGKWLDSKDHDVIYAVADESSGLAVGDRFTLDTYYFAPEDVKFENAITITCNFEVVGIAGNNTKLFGLDKTFTEKDDFRNLYGTYEPNTDTYDNNTVRRIYIPTRQFERFTENKLKGAFTNTKYIVSFDDNISKEKAEELYTQLAMYGSVIKLSEFSRLSKLYVYDKIVQLLPILICIALLMVVSTVSVSTLNTKMSLRTYAIYYTLGCTWNRSIEISFVNAMLTTLSAVCVCIAAVSVLKIQGFLKNTVFAFGKAELMFCLIAFLMYMLCSLLSPLVCINNTSPKENLRANE